MYSWIAGMVVRRAIRQVNTGNTAALLRGYADDAVVVFPGEHSWAGTYRGRDEIERLFRRVNEVGLRFRAGDVVAKGPPWALTVCFQLFDRLASPDGTLVYANRVMERLETAWGKIRSQEVYLDTQKVAELDRYLEPVDEPRRSERHA
jgi:ketosteroid isomerase-like protein